jgi:hypothetical protein
MKLQHSQLFQSMVFTAIVAGGMLHGQAMAAGTLAGTDIVNKATLNFSVGGTAQSPVNSSPTGNALPGATGGANTTFKVDRRINLVVATTNSAPVPVALGNTNMVTSFNVTNFTNDAIDVILSNINNQPLGSTGATGTDSENFINTACSMHTTLADAQANTNPTTRLVNVPASEVAPATPVTVPVFLRCDIQTLVSLSGTNNTYAYWNNKVNVVSLIGQAAPSTASGGGGAFVEALGVADDAAVVQNVFGDEAGGNGGVAGATGTTANGGAGPANDIYRDGKHSANSAYKVVTPILTVTKTETLVCDPLNGTASPKRIPGALVKYTIVVANDLTASASGILNTVTDTLQSDLTHDVDFVTGTSPATCVPGAAPSGIASSGFRLTNSILAGGTQVRPTAAVYFTNAPDIDGASITGQAITVNYANGLPVVGTTHTAGELKSGETVTIEYQVFIK